LKLLIARLNLVSVQLVSHLADAQTGDYGDYDNFNLSSVLELMDGQRPKQKIKYTENELFVNGRKKGEDEDKFAYRIEHPTVLGGGAVYFTLATVMWKPRGE
jgi:hypothetical protein